MSRWVESSGENFYVECHRYRNLLCGFCEGANSEDGIKIEANKQG